MNTNQTARMARISGLGLVSLAILLTSACEDELEPSATPAPDAAMTATQDAAPVPDTAPAVVADAAPTDAVTSTDAVSGDAASADAGTADAAPPVPPLYAFASEVYTPDFSSSTSFVGVMPSLDVSEVSLAKTREYSGRATIGTVGGWLFVAGGQSPIVERYTIAADGTLTESGRISFMNRGVKSLSLDAWGNTFISPTKAYLFNDADGVHIVWNPTTMEIVGEIATPGLVRGTLALQSSPGIVRGKRLFRVFTFIDWKQHAFSSEPQQLGIYDVETDKLVGMVTETRCPALYSAPFIDEAGHIYFTNHIWNVTETLVRKGPKSCALRIRAGEERFDPSWTLSYAAVAEGREGAVLTYLGGGKGLLDVFHHERTMFDATTDPLMLGRSSNWRLWLVDLEKGTGAPLTGLDHKAGGYTKVDVGTRSLLMLPGDGYATTTAYEVKDGQAVTRFKMKGSSYLVVKVR